VALYPRPTDKTLVTERERVEGLCPSCGSTEIARYPVHSEGGWFRTTRCQNCLHQLDRERWTLYGPVEFLSDQIKEY
jgi:predicted RNA-binding Zn-ribbon protein involved in translation (DUF1610 family)